MEFLRSFLRRHFAEKPEVASRNVGCFSGYSYLLIYLLYFSFVRSPEQSPTGVKTGRLPLHSTVEPRNNPRDWQNLFAITRFRYIDVLFHILY